MSFLRKILSTSRVGAGGLIRLIQKNWYWIIFLIVITINIMPSIQTSIETKNPSYPFIQLGLHLTNADQVIYNDVQILKENPEELIGMSKPSEGIWFNVVYYWKLFWNVIFKFIGNLWLITFPFVLFYKYFKFSGSKGIQSSSSSNALKAIIYGVIFIFFINLILTIHGLATESIIYNFPENTGIYQKTWIIILTTLPFHGVVSLIQYLLSIKFYLS